MRDRLLSLLVDPRTRASLVLEDPSTDGDELVSGVLRAADGRAYPIRSGIPRFVLETDELQEQTSQAFAYKWGKRESYDSPEMISTARTWLLARYGFEDAPALARFFAERTPVLDAGCGSGFSTSTWLEPGWAATGSDWIGAEISEAVDAAAERLRGIGGTHFVQADLTSLPFRSGTFGAIFAEGVLHHTPSTRDGFAALVDLLRPEGEILFYVYRRKSAVREFTDDHVRLQLADASDDEAWTALRSLTRLGQALSEVRADVEIPEDVPLLGIRAGRYDVQRLVYWHFAKLFWNPDLTFEENNHVQFDWYRPRYAHRHDASEVRGWCDELGLAVTRFDEQESGFTVRARRS